MKKIILQLFFSSALITQAAAQCCVGGPGPELVINGDFSQGNTGFTTAYTLSSFATPGYYGIVTNARQANSPWSPCTDHTTGAGNFMWVDASSTSSINLWTQQVSNIQPNTSYIFSCWVSNLYPANPAVLQFSVNNSLIGKAFTAPTTVCNWVQFYYLWYSGNSTSATITITNQSKIPHGNDMGIDDISFRMCTPPSSNVAAAICPGNTHKLPAGKTASAAGLYQDTLQNQYGCDSVINTTLSILAPAKDSAYTQPPTCVNSNDGNIHITATGGSSPYTFVLNTSDTSSTGEFDSLPNGNYFYTITDSKGCTTIGNCTIQKPGKFMSVYASPPDTTIDPGSPVDLTVTSANPNAIYEWHPPTFLSCTQCPNPTAMPLTDITYTVTAIVKVNGADCKADTTVRIYMNSDFWIPNSFTPNGDLWNDYFTATTTGLKEFELKIYNRYGEEIFNCNGLNCQWDGTYKHKPCPIGVYAYIIFAKTNASVRINKAGNVTLLR